MNSLPRVALGVLAGACWFASAAALAQPYDQSGPLTRAQVRADLIEWRQAGYDPMDWVNYPENAQRAGAIVAQRRASRAPGGAAGQMSQ
ncbi:DUF4148 domain-containing protein [Paraburkholderia sp. JHI2823]|uniref:DUF4148 domain-containing protein n=1 Tax=Paraburkholderia sp. JHI2823 TaxID=3112960 RepID=UPI003171E743